MNKTLITNIFLPENILRVSLFSFYIGIILNTGISIAAPIATLEKWKFNPQSQELEITLSSTTQPEYFYLQQPPRLVVDLPNTQLGKVDTKKEYPTTKQKVRASQFTSNITRIVIDLQLGTYVDVNQVKLQPLSKQNPTRWVLRSPSPNYSNNPSTLSSPNAWMTLPPPSTNLPTNSQPFVIVPPPNFPQPSQLSNLTIIPPNSANSSENQNLITVPNSQNNPNPIINIPIIEFGQPLPQMR
jgi:N-acetylmuramoyl-L-alanine amidase